MYKYFFTTVFTKPEKKIVKLTMDSKRDYAINIGVKSDKDLITFQEVLDENNQYSITRK